jgi:hypothetical protein
MRSEAPDASAALIRKQRPRDLYALYLRRGLVSRAKQFRDAIRRSSIYDDYIFDMAERNPAAYVP